VEIDAVYCVYVDGSLVVQPVGDRVSMRFEVDECADLRWDSSPA
jgi:hypothetical protein